MTIESGLRAWATRAGASRKGLLQSPGEWDARNRALAASIAELVVGYVRPGAKQGLDIGCQTGALADALVRRTGLAWHGVDPAIHERTVTAGGVELLHGWANALPFPDRHFDCAVLANVYEHIPPAERRASLLEIRRVLNDGGVLVGQLPNPYFAIEAHSRLPFLGWLPYRLQKQYWRLSPVSWEHDFYVVSIGDLQREAERSGFATARVRTFAYPPAAIPASVRRAAGIMAALQRVMPWSWQFVLRKA